MYLIKYSQIILLYIIILEQYWQTNETVIFVSNAFGYLQGRTYVLELEGVNVKS